MCDRAAAVARPSTLLDWYDRNARALPWRIAPGSPNRADPYRVWLSEVMLQQTTVAAVKAYFENFTRRWPDVRALAAADDGEVMGAWAGLGYYARARNLLTCARTVAHVYGGRFPDTEEGLRGLPGIGPYTAAAIAAIAFDRHATVVDGNVERVMARLHAVEAPLPDAKRALSRLAAGLTPTDRPGDYAQAVMDLGATVCTPRNPACGLCPWAEACTARQLGIAADLPRRREKPDKPVRFGCVYVARSPDGSWLLERRPERGLLGGMLGWPGTDWNESGFPPDAPPERADWHTLADEVRHTFTHFHLRLAVRVAMLSENVEPSGNLLVPADTFRADDLPTVMRKAFRLAEPWHGRLLVKRETGPR